MENEEMKKLNPFIIVPKEEQCIITPMTLLVYANLRRFMNGQTKKAYPSLQTLTKLCDCSINTLQKHIRILVDNDYVRIEKQGQHNVYVFPHTDSFEPFSEDFLDNPDLTAKEKAYIIASQRYMFKNKENETGKISYSDRELAKKINMSRNVINQCNESLVNKNYLIVQQSKERDLLNLGGCVKQDKIFLLSPLGQKIVFTLQDHENRLQEVEKEIALQKESRKTIENLERQIKELTNIILRQNKS
jgi:DNA-binding transcriptional regulator YhcF (GntR family)